MEDTNKKTAKTQGHFKGKKKGISNVWFKRNEKAVSHLENALICSWNQIENI